MSIKTGLLIFALVAGFLTSSLAFAQQYARPSSTVATGGFAPTGAATLHEAVDEVTANDSDFIRSPESGTANVELGLSGDPVALTDPNTGTGHIMRMRMLVPKNGTGATFHLYQGNTLIASTAALSPNNLNTYQTFTYNLTAGEANAISNYNDLRIRVAPSGLAKNKYLEVSWIELEVPTAVAVTPPTVDTPTFSAVTHNSAILGGTVSNDGGATVTDRGTVWGTSLNPTGNSLSQGSGTGAFTHSRTGLPANTLVYFRAYATNSQGTSYSTNGSFTTDPTPTPPTVTSPTFTAVTDTTATLGGTVTADGGATVTDRGTVWGISPSPTGNSLSQGSGTGTFTHGRTGLPAGTLIYFRAYATNSVGTSFSADGSFTTLTLPTVDTPTVTAVTDNTATLGGTVSADGGATVTDRGTVWGTNPNPTGNSLSQGTGIGTFTHGRTGLPAGTLIYFRAYASNSVGTAYSVDGSFTTAAGLPTVTAPTFTAVTETTATLGGNVSSDGGGIITARGTVWGLAANPDIVAQAANVNTVAGTTGVFTGPVSGLPAGTLIHFRAYASNSAGTSYSADSTFSTTTPPIAPTVDTPTFTAVTDTTATLGGNVSSDGGGTITARGTVWGLAANPNIIAQAANVNTVAGTTGVFTGPVTGLPAGTLIHFRAYASNSVGTSYSADSTFTTSILTAPTVTVQAAAVTGSSTATLNGNVTVNGTATNNDTYFKYGTSTLTYTVTTASAGIVTTGPFSLGVTGLLPSTTYYYIACATANEPGGLEGCSSPTEASFTTDPATLTAPTVTVQAATSIGTNSATLNGNVTVNGTAANNDTYFKYGTSTGVYTLTTASAGTVTTGAFSLGLTGLTPNTTYYYIACATAIETGGLEGCSSPTEASFTTVATVSQPTNLRTHNIGATAMTLFWNEGFGDGSIVVIKQGSAVDAVPVDGTEHLADKVFGSGADLGGGNFVVYRGNGESVHVTGLTSLQTYHVAVFTYTGAGVLIEYLLPSPARISETTVENTPHNVAVLNIDDTVTCTTGCHGGHGSALVPRGAEQETACVSCHNPASGVPGASALTNFSLHTNSKGMPLSSPGVVDCGSCHELHNPAGDDTTYTQNPISSLWDYNLHYLRANPDKYVPTALPWPANNLVAHADTNSEDWAFEDGAAYQGACQICHTDTSHYQNTAGDDIHQGGDLGNVDCRSCHDHGGAFAGAGGDCTACHNSVQDKDGAGGNPGRRIVTTEFSGGPIVSSHLPGTLDALDCEVCHDQSSHQAGQVTLFDPDGGTSISIASYTDPRASQAEAEKLTAFCVACHDGNGANGNTSPFTTPGTTVNIQASLGEHTNDGSGSVGCFGDGNFGCHGSGHGGQKLAILTPAESGPGAGPDFTDENETFCLNCHDGGTPVLTPAAPNILADLGGSFAVSVEKVEADSGAFVNQNHDILPADKDWNAANDPGAVRPQITCSDCHLPPHDATAGSPLKDPDTGLDFPMGLAGTYSKDNTYTDDGHNWSYNSGADQSPITPEGMVTPHDPTDYVEFCLTCHDGTTPAGIVQSASLLDIAATYGADDYHGNQPNGGTGTSINRGGMKAPWTAGGDSKNEDPSAPYAAMPCTICHGPHGSGNIFNLRTSITVAGVELSTGSWGTGDPMDSIIGTVYELPRFGAGGTQENRVWGAWCTFCHQLSAHSYSEDQTCRSGHQHGGGNF